MRKLVETTIISVNVPAEIYDNGDGTWTAVVSAPLLAIETANSREAALNDVRDAVSWVYRKSPDSQP